MLDQLNSLSSQLSGGQKRRLSIALALVGNPKILILDEPSSGANICSQSLLWEIIHNLRKQRCVIISTQSMAEADVLTDRKLIISKGNCVVLEHPYF